MAYLLALLVITSFTALGKQESADDDHFHTDLQGLKLGALKRKAKEEHVGAEDIEQADDSDDPAQTVKDLIVRAREANAVRLAAPSTERSGNSIAADDTCGDAKTCNPKERLASSGQLWQETFITSRAAHYPSLAVAFKKGESLIEVPDFVTLEERKTLANSGFKVSQKMKEIEMPKHYHESVWRIGVAEDLDENAKAVSWTIVKRLLALIETDMPELALTLFGCASQLVNKSIEWYGEGDGEEGDLEPMVNVYKAGGSFPQHKDGKNLTILVPLTTKFTGGGTAFVEDPGDDIGSGKVMKTLHEARPEAGTALVWGKEVMHSGLPVKSGRRIVYVGSFDVLC